MALWAQPEDKMWPELYDVLRNRDPRHFEYRKHRSFRAAISRGGSGNWPWLAAGVAATLGEDMGWLLAYTSRDNDWWLNEPNVDDMHSLYILCGMTACRDAILGRLPIQANILTMHLKQYWATSLLCGSAMWPYEFNRTWIVAPGARASSPKTERGIREYVFHRARGVSHEGIRALPGGRRMCRVVERTYAFQEVSLRSVIDQLASSFASDAAPVLLQFESEAWTGLNDFMVEGTRVPFTFHRYGSGYAAVMVRNCNGNDGPRFVSMSGNLLAQPVQYPQKKAPRQRFDHGIAGILQGWVRAQSDFSPPFVSRCPPGELLYSITTDSNGCIVGTQLDKATIQTEPLHQPLPPEKKSWIEKLKEWLPW